jgi:hypothetical protein
VGWARKRRCEEKHDKNSLIYGSKKKRRFSLLNYLNLFIDIPIVAEVERFQTVRLGGFNRGFIVGFSSPTKP